MKTLGKLLLIGAIGSAGAGCSGDSTGTSIPNIVGSWHATTAVVTSIANPANTANLIALGAGFQVTFNANLTYTSTTTVPGEQPDVSTGTYVETATQLVLHDSGGIDVTTFTVALSGGSLLLTGGTPFTFNFGAGDVPSKLDLTLVH